MALPPRPSFAPAETAWLFVPVRRTAGWNMVLAGVVILAFAAVNLGRTGARFGLALHIAAAAFGVLSVLFGLSLALRRGPVLTADPDGITASMTGFDRSRLPWELIRGARVVGKKKQERALVILAHDVDAALKLVYPTVVSGIRSMNKRHKVGGGLYVMARLMGRDPESVAPEIERIAGDLAKAMQVETEATSPAGASRSSRPA